MPLPKSLTTVTPLSKTLVMILFILLPLITFFLGVRYQQKISSDEIKVLKKQLNKENNEKMLLQHTGWGDYRGYGMSILYPLETTPKLKRGNNNSTLLSFVHKHGSNTLSISIIKYDKSLRDYQTELQSVRSSSIHYKPANFKDDKFNGYDSLEYEQAWNKYLVVIANGYIYSISNPRGQDGLLKQSVASIKFNKAYF